MTDGDLQASTTASHEQALPENRGWGRALAVTRAVSQRSLCHASGGGLPVSVRTLQ